MNRFVCVWLAPVGAVASVVLGGCHAPPAQASLQNPSVTLELVESAPVETTLDHPDVANTSDVWVEMLDRARDTIDLAEFYASEPDPGLQVTSKLTPVIDAVERAVRRGVRVRLVVDSVFAPKYPRTLEHLRRAGVAVRVLDFAKHGGGGIMHAKYITIDDTEAFLGSQNFDWRALDHIQEIGVRFTSPVLARALGEIFETDWARATGAPSGSREPPRASSLRRERAAQARTGETLELVGSPKNWLPDASAWELPKLVAMVNAASRAIDVQVLSYSTTDREGQPFHVLDDALRLAAARGVHVKLLVSEWSTKPGSDARKALSDVAKLPNVEVRVLRIPAWSGGSLPFARVAHAKYMVIDGTYAWVGTSNWEGGYFTQSRNVGLLISNGTLPPRLDAVFNDGWKSPYAAPLSAEAP